MKVSVVLPVYNGENYIKRCMESLLKQTLTEYEVLCIDDGSTDASGRILDQYQKKYPNKIRVFHVKNSGVWKARELGIREAKGDYIGFCDCDDYVEPEMYQVLYERIQEDHSEMAICAYNRVEIETGKILCCEMQKFGDHVVSVEEKRDLLPVINTSLWNKLIRADIVRKHICFETAPRVAEDMMFLLSIYPFIKKISFSSSSLYIYRVRSDSAMSYIKKEEIELLKESMIQTKGYVLKQTGEVWKDIINIFALIHFGVAVVLKSAKGKKKETIMIQKNIEQWLTNEFDGWKHNPYLKMRFVFHGHKYLIKPMIIVWMYQIRLFPVFLKLYLWITELLKIDMKW